MQRERGHGDNFTTASQKTIYLKINLTKEVKASKLKSLILKELVKYEYM